jgi:hypothetical protein
VQRATRTLKNSSLSGSGHTDTMTVCANPYGKHALDALEGR